MLTVTLPKFTDVADTEGSDVPVPLNVTVCPVLPALSLMVNVPASSPGLVGSKVKARVQDAPAAKAVLVEQVVDGSRANPVPPVRTRLVKVRLCGVAS